eukprot:6177258-Pleurochrysis_carterae.AAC.1
MGKSHPTEGQDASTRQNGPAASHKPLRKPAIGGQHTQDTGTQTCTAPTDPRLVAARSAKAPSAFVREKDTKRSPCELSSHTRAEKKRQR